MAGFDARIDSASVLPPSCGQPLRQVPLEVSPSHGNYQYRWVEGEREYPAPLMTDIPTGMHTFRITDDNHCALYLTYEMSTNTCLALSCEEEDLVRCPG